MRPFVPLFSNSHLLTIAAHFWPARLDTVRFPVETKLYRTEPGVQVLVCTQRPAAQPAGDVVLVHGLEGSAEATYMKSMAQAALEAGFAAHRMNLRTCGRTEALCPTLYHSGLTSDLRVIARQLAEETGRPVHLVGFSLGGNLCLKLAGESGEAAPAFVAGVCAVSTPIDLAACVSCLERPENRIYELRFVNKLKRRMRARHRLFPQRYPLDGLHKVRTLRQFDDRFTAPAFGFRDAAHYYATQSALRFFDAIRVPVLLIQAKSDPLIPFRVFERTEVSSNPYVTLLAVEHGGHLGFLSRGRPRFWCDAVIAEWLSAGKIS